MYKQEFEKLINKKVTYQTYLIYENMYSSTDLTKDEFIKLLNIKVIPEDPEITKLRKSYIENIEYADAQIEYHTNYIKLWEDDIKVDEFAKCEYFFHKNQITYYRKLKKYYKSQIKNIDENY